MQHLDPDRLVDLALFDSSTNDDEAVHLDACLGCRAEIEALQQVAQIGAETQSVRDLPPPPESVWAGIAAATARTDPEPAHDDVVRPIRPSRRRRLKWLPPFLLAAAAAVLAVAGTVTVLDYTGRPPAAEVTARAALTPLATAPPTAKGDAEVLDGRQLRVDVSDLPLTAGYYEVWLLNPDDTTKMQSLGSLPGSPEAVDLPIPPGTDLNTYRLVDVSAEAHDGDSAHSGDSLLRGTLTN